MLCKSLFCGAKVRPFYEVAKDFNKKQHIIPVYRTIFLNRRALMHAMQAKIFAYTKLRSHQWHDLNLHIIYKV